MNFAALLAGCVGQDNVLIGVDAQGYLTDWRKTVTGSALAVVRPANTEQVAAIMRLCAEHRIPVVPQGGNTGQVAGATPDSSGRAVVISLQRMNRVREIDTDNETITVDAGCVLANVQAAAQQAGKLFPLSLGAEGSCLIGGNLATNAGGTQVLRYGNARELTLGLEVVTPQGDIWHGLRGLRKDNTGYDLRDLYIGSEGTLGVITAATLKLYPLPQSQATALVCLTGLDQATAFLNRLKSAVGHSLTGFELMSGRCLDLVTQVFPEQRLPLPCDSVVSAWFALVELSDSQSGDYIERCFETVLEQACDAGEIADAALASSVAQQAAFWHLRESITLALAQRGRCIKHDISLPASQLVGFVRDMDTALTTNHPGVQLMVFGHLGDGNLHYNLLAPPGLDEQGFKRMQSEIQRCVHDEVVARSGSISAEQGIGQLRVDDLARYKNPVELDLMRRIKHALDPLGIMNPGKVLGS